MSVQFTNKDIAKILREIAAAYEILDKKFFEIRAYDQAAESVEHSTVPVGDLINQGKLQSLPGIGGSIAQHLEDLISTGRSKHFEKIKQKLPSGMFELLEIPGVGPKNSYKLSKELNISSIEDLKRACQDGLVATLDGFGEKSQAKILTNITTWEKLDTDRLLLPYAYEVTAAYINYLQESPEVLRVDPLGSLRRMVATIGDIDLAVQSDNPRAVIKQFVSYPEVAEVLNRGQVKSSVRLKDNTQVDLRVQNEKSYGSLLQYFTGSKNHNIKLRELAIKKDLSISEYGIKRGGQRGELVEFSTEEELYHFLDLPWVPPELREDNGEIEAALAKRLPRLVELSDIKGDLHAHCNFDLEESHDAGQSSITEIVEWALNHHYSYIAIGNHSPAVSNHSQDDIKRLLLKKQEEIDRVQKQYRRIKLLNMVEVDILADNSLALNDSNLQLLDVAIAAVHSSFSMSRESMTQRIVQALSNPYIHGLAHPTGRILNQRAGYKVDWDKIFKICREQDKFLEINSFPTRLDLSDVLIKEAIRAGVKLAINTDAHRVEQLDLIRFGVGMARRGWAESEDIVNTKTNFN